jgi:glucose-6-phosphate 1-epimerase
MSMRSSNNPLPAQPAMDETPDTLNAQFKKPGVIFDAGVSQLPRITINTDLAECEIYLHGAHVTHWRPRRHHPVLWLSETAQFAPGKAIRGGIPLCWPWFGPHPADPAAKAHGFARTSVWQVKHTEILPDGAAQVILALNSDEGKRTLWPHDFALELDVRAGKTLSVTMRTSNLSDAPISITEALHTYLAVGDVREAAISGLSGVEYVDQLRGHTRAIEQDAALAFGAETDRIYQTSHGCVLRDPGMNRVITVAKRGSGSSVIWNPWIDKTARLGDVPPTAWTRFVCVETANAFEHAVLIAPGGSHVIDTTLSVDWLSA